MPHARSGRAHLLTRLAGGGSTSFDLGRLEVGAKVAVAYDPDDPQSADLTESWRLYSGPVVATLLYAAVVYYALLA